MTGMIFAYVGRSGVISFGPHLPEGYVPVLKGPENHVREVIELCARKEDQDWTIPGMSAALTKDDALRIAIGFVDICMARIHQVRMMEREASRCLH